MKGEYAGGRHGGQTYKQRRDRQRVVGQSDEESGRSVKGPIVALAHQGGGTSARDKASSHLQICAGALPTTPRTRCTRLAQSARKEFASLRLSLPPIHIEGVRCLREEWLASLV